MIVFFKYFSLERSAAVEQRATAELREAWAAQREWLEQVIIMMSPHFVVVSAGVRSIRILTLKLRVFAHFMGTYDLMFHTFLVFLLMSEFGSAIYGHG